MFNLVNIGTLLAFIIVCASVLLLRFRRRIARLSLPIRLPGSALGILVVLAMMLFLPIDTWLRLIIWLGIGLVIYFLYGRIHSTLAKDLRAGKA